MQLSSRSYGTLQEIYNLNSQQFMHLVHYELFQYKYAQYTKQLNNKDDN